MGDSVIHKILLAYDGSEDSEKAALLAGDLATKYEVSVVVCHAIGHMPMATKPSEVRRMINPVVEKLNKIGVSTQISIPDELPAEGILNTAEETGADLIVLGCRGRGTFANLLIGSTAERVLHFAKVPVLVVR
ncbi:MAG TPA: universal stress protein [Thermoleophilia bacterium]|nr:universal stress protein [Thermoleophilia bacterium]